MVVLEVIIQDNQIVVKVVTLLLARKDICVHFIEMVLDMEQVEVRDVIHMVLLVLVMQVVLQDEEQVEVEQIMPLQIDDEMQPSMEVEVVEEPFLLIIRMVNDEMATKELSSWNILLLT
ncbi:hypothetical protein FACS1894176_06240 [Bacteroidia bacterium]|nr:hypothetical protein FACS1894176_06240 [Bacteroidia bacterium]